MAADLALYVIAPPLSRGHTVAMLRGYENSGFFDAFDDGATALNDAAVEEARSSFGPDEVFAEGPCRGRPIASLSAKMQALALAPRMVALTVDQIAAIKRDDLPLFDREGTAFVIGFETGDDFEDAYADIGIDPQPVLDFLRRHHGMTAVLVAE